MPHKPVYAFLGPAGTFSDAAVRDFVAQGTLDASYEPYACDTLTDVFEAVDRGQADYGVVPIENSLEGSVTAVLDAFAFSTRSQIVAETVLDIHQALVLAPGATLEGVETVVSHPQGLAQCRRWIASKLPGRPLRVADSTAAAVLEASRDKTIAAIGSPLAADLAGAQVYAQAIEDNLSSQTRFVLISNGGRRESLGEGPGKTTLAVFINADRPGTLQMILSEFTYAQVNLTMIQSRPTKRDLGDYMFFIDIEGYADEPDIRTALDCLRLKLREVRVIGSYPSAVPA